MFFMIHEVSGLPYTVAPASAAFIPFKFHYLYCWIEIFLLIPYTSFVDTVRFFPPQLQQGGLEQCRRAQDHLLSFFKTQMMDYV